MNNEGPGNDVEQLKFCSIMQFDVKGWGTIRPVEQDANWGDNALCSKEKGGDGYGDYLLINSFTDEGLDKIADYNNYRGEWDSEKRQFTEGIHMMQKRFVNFKLYAKHRDRRCYHLCPIEGGHRRIGNIQASFCGKFDFNRGSLKDTASMKVHHFTDAGLGLKDAARKPQKMNEQILAAYLKEVDSAERGDGFFSESDTVKVIYMTSWDTPVPKLLSACSVVSDMHSRTKRQSATKDPFVEIGHYASKYMLSMPDKNFKHDPDLANISYEGQNKFPAKKDKKDLPEDLHWNGDRNKLRIKLPLTDILYSEAFEAYCKDPFCISKTERLMDEFESFGVKPTIAGRWETDESVKLRPPYRVSWKSMAVHPALGRHQRATSEMVNKWVLVPKFMHIFTAHKTHTSLFETSRNKELERQVLYITRHHVHNHFASNLGAHPCIKIVYKFQVQPQCLPTSSYTIMHASLYLAKVVNAYLTDETLHDPSKSIESKKAYLRENAKDVATLFSTLNQNEYYPGLDEMIAGLGNVLFRFFYIL